MRAITTDSMVKDTLFGFELPMPALDLYVALGTVAAFLPVVYIVHHTIAFVLRLFTKRA